MDQPADHETAAVQARPQARHPLGPLWRRVTPHDPKPVRVRAGLVLAGGVAVVVLAGLLTPDEQGVGTHRQLGLPPCSLIQVAGIPCPTCGMTTSFAHAVRGRPLSAFLTQPFAFLLAVSVLVSCLLAVAVLISGRTWEVNWYRLPPTRVMVAVLVVFGSSWVFKILSHLAQQP